jgi:amino acid adenylation domain-containing protein
MTTAEFLSYMMGLGIKVWVKDDKLHVRAPKDVLSPNIQQELAQRKEAILTLLKDTYGATDRTETLPIIQPAPRNGHIPLSFAQERLWFLNELDPNSPNYNLFQANTIRGELNILALEQALQTILQRHESLRTIFQTVEGQPVQYILPEISFSLPVIDLRHHTQTECEQEVNRLTKAEASQPFDLAQGPLLRATLLWCEETTYIFLLNMHHIVSDGWSMQVFDNELTTLYRAFSIGESFRLPPLTIQYADFAVWQRQWLTGEILEKQVSYWRKKLAQSSVLLELPTDRSRPSIQTFAGGYHRFVIDEHITHAVYQLSHNNGATLFMTLLAAFKTLLYRYSGQTDILVGTPIANRRWAEIENLIGFFVNTLVLRSDLSNQPTFRQLLAQVRQVALEAYEHQDLPFEKLVEELNPERSLSHHPLFQVMFTLQTTPNEADQPGIDNLESTGANVEGAIAKFDLTLYIVERDNVLEGGIEYNIDLFAQVSIERMATHFQALLKAITENPDQSINKFPLLTAAEKEQLLETWNSTQVNYEIHGGFHQLFETQAAQTPLALAVSCAGELITYETLNHRANQIAHFLQSKGVGPEVIVGVCMERSIDMVAALLGILKAGAAYLPLDPNYPADRLSFMLTDTGVAFILTHEVLFQHLPSTSAYVICLDSEWPQITKAMDSNLSVPMNHDMLAYLVYTSGSTGKPKGVCITHGNVRALLKWSADIFPTSALRGVLAGTSICFDLSIYEIFFPLSCGGCVILADDVLQISTLPERDSITLINTVPSAMQELLNMNSIPDTVHIVNLAGEPLRRALVDSIYQKTAVETIYNLYGPSEDTTYSTFKRVSPTVTGEPTIGRPIANTQAYILDMNVQPAPVGVIGELYLGGLGVSRGYFNRPGLTAARYVPHPFARNPGERLYKTGDLVRYLANGEIVFLGRQDHQIKIRGFRVELGEIEAALSTHPVVEQAIVHVQEDILEDKQLVAYFTTQVGSLSPSTGELRNYLRDRLPDYMLPNFFITLETLPLTPNGKIDRKALPATEQSHTQLETAFVPPRTRVEAELATIWLQFLKVAEIGIYDNFFELGGHSLIATQVVSRIREHFQIEITVRALFESPTIVELADYVQMQESAIVEEHTSVGEHPAIQRVPRNGRIPLSFAQERLWFLNELEPNSPNYNIFQANTVRGELNILALEQALQEILKRHESLRTVFQIVDGQPVQVILPEVSFTLMVIDLRHHGRFEREQEVKRLAAAEASQPFDLAQGPLLRATLLWCEETTYVFLLNMHHIVSDGWSMQIFDNELTTLYRAFSVGEPSPLPALSVQYADFALWQRRWLSGNVLEKQLNYWQKQLAYPPLLLELPTDRPRPPIQTFVGAYHNFVINENITQVLYQLSQKSGATLFMTLLAAFKTLLYRYTGQTDILVGTPIANRRWSEIENLIGFFVNTLVLRSDFSNQPTFRQLLEQVRQTALEAYEHQDLPFEKLVEELKPERSLSHHPLFQVMFALQNMPDDPSQRDVDELESSSTDIEGAIAKFDLTLNIVERDKHLEGSFEYNTDLFDLNTIVGMVSHWQTLLAEIVSNPDAPVSKLTLLSQDEKTRLLSTWNDTEASYRHDMSLHERIESWAEQTPRAPAVAFVDDILTYEELNQKANKLARYLQKMGVTTETLVGICLEPSLDMVPGMVAILKAGGAYVPLDPTYPEQRLHFIMNDTQMPVLLTHSSLKTIFAHYEGNIVCIDMIENALAYESDANLLRSAISDNLAYILYTSGSTGEPKGVSCHHGGVLNLLADFEQRLPLLPKTRCSLWTSLNFDVSVYELFGPLTVGATLYIVPNDIRADAKAFMSWLAQEKIQSAYVPPFMIKQLFQASQEMSLSLQRLLVGVEPILESLLVAIQQHVAGLHIINGYGPTEATICATLYDIQTDKDHETNTPIGRPVQNMQVYLLDQHANPVPVGVLGELYIGGVGLARGYWQRPSHTAGSFVPHPFSDEPGARLYRTGDLARYLPEGNIQFMGRQDYQVKVRGFRIELGEIQKVLDQHPLLQEAVVLVREDTPEDKHLVAYVVAAPEQTPTAQTLRLFLAERLPHYMIPGIFVYLNALPRTPNRKIDRKALPAPERVSTTVSAPRTFTEEILTVIWTEVLGLEQVGIFDSFFELGGHSLMATQVASRVRQTFLVELPIRALFEFVTIADLAEHIEAQKTNRTGPLISTH